MEIFAIELDDKHRLESVMYRLYRGESMTYDERRDLAATLLSILDYGEIMTIPDPISTPPAKPTLVYDDNNIEVAIGDTVRLDDGWYDVTGIIPPHKPSSTGRVQLTLRGDDTHTSHLYFPSVIDAHWINRNDQQD